MVVENIRDFTGQSASAKRSQQSTCDVGRESSQKVMDSRNNIIVGYSGTQREQLGQERSSVNGS